MTLAKDFQISRRVPNPLFGCVGALDGIAIEISKPKDDYFPRKFYCRKGVYAIPVQAVVSSSYKFMYMSVTCAGSTHYSVALGLSSLGRKLQLGTFIAGYWIAGDAAYECKNGIVTHCSKSQLMDDEEGGSRYALIFFSPVFAFMWNKHWYAFSSLWNSLEAFAIRHLLCPSHFVRMYEVAQLLYRPRSTLYPKIYATSR